jgi:hypothetical protein
MVRHNNASYSVIRAVAFAGHSMAATSIFTLVLVTSNIFILDGGNVTRVPEKEEREKDNMRNEEARAAGLKTV